MWTYFGVRPPSHPVPPPSLSLPPSAARSCAFARIWRIWTPLSRISSRVFSKCLRAWREKPKIWRIKGTVKFYCINFLTFSIHIFENWIFVPFPKRPKLQKNVTFLRPAHFFLAHFDNFHLRIFDEKPSVTALCSLPASVTRLPQNMRNVRVLEISCGFFFWNFI